MELSLHCTYLEENCGHAIFSVPDPQNMMDGACSKLNLKPAMPITVYEGRVDRRTFD